MGGTIDSPTLESAKTLQKSLMDVFDTGVIQDFYILHANSSVYVGDVEYVEEPPELILGVVSSNLGIIVGLAVGGGVLLTIILVVLYKIKNGRKEGKVYEYDE